MPGGRSAESLPISLTFVLGVSVLAILLESPPARIGTDTFAAWPVRAASGEASLARQAAVLRLLRVADPALSARAERVADPAALASADLARLDGLLAAAGSSAREFFGEQARLSRSPARRARFLALLGERRAEYGPAR